MAAPNPVHLDKSGSLPKAATPKAIQASAKARDSFARIIFGGSILGLLAIAYIAALFCEIEGANNILVILGSGLGFLLGGQDRGASDGT